MKILITGGCGFVGLNFSYLSQKKLNKAQNFIFWISYTLKNMKITLKDLKKIKLKIQD